MKVANNCHVTEDTLKYYNDIVKRLYSMKNSYVSGIRVHKQYGLQRGWADTQCSPYSSVMNINMTMHRELIEYFRNRYERKIVVDDIVLTLNSQETMTIQNLGPGETSYTGRMNKTDYRVEVPAGCSGKDCFVEFYVGENVFQSTAVNYGLHCRPVVGGFAAGVTGGWDDVDIPTLRHALLRSGESGYGGGYGNTSGRDSLTSQIYGYYRPNALFFYANFTEGNQESENDIKFGKISMNVNKFEDHISITTSNVTLSKPFKSFEVLGSTIFRGTVPKVTCRVTFYRRGV